MNAPLNTDVPASFEDDLAGFAGTQRIEALRTRLADRGADELDLHWFVQETPLGPLMISAQAGRVVRVAFEREDFDAVQEGLAQHFGPRTLRSDRGLEFVRDQLEEYFTGARTSFEVPVDLALTHGDFRRAVQLTLPEIGYGRTVTYRELATDAGRPAAVRAAASACATNPLPVLVPCHRVVRSDGTIGAYLGGTAAKKWLLEHEATTSRRPRDVA